MLGPLACALTDDLSGGGGGGLGGGVRVQITCFEIAFYFAVFKI